MKSFREKYLTNIWNVPNILTIIRLLLIPVFVALHAAGHDKLALLTFCTASATDWLDGYIARKYNLITNFGKFMDPLADKLTQLGLLICLSVRRKMLKYLLVIFLIKEFWQFFAMIGAMRRGKALNGALWSGKVSTTVLFTGLGLMFLFPNLSDGAVNAIAAVCLVFLLYAFGDYAMAYFGKNKKIYDLE